MSEAFEQCAMAMFGYMTEIDTVSMTGTESIEAEGKQIASCPKPHRLTLHVVSVNY